MLENFDQTRNNKQFTTRFVKFHQANTRLYLLGLTRTDGMVFSLLRPGDGGACVGEAALCVGEPPADMGEPPLDRKEEVILTGACFLAGDLLKEAPR